MGRIVRNLAHFFAKMYVFGNKCQHILIKNINECLNF